MTQIHKRSIVREIKNRSVRLRSCYFRFTYSRTGWSMHIWYAWTPGRWYRLCTLEQNNECVEQKHLEQALEGWK